MATIPSFRTWVTGEVVTAAFMNSNIRDAGNFFLSWPVFEGRQTVAQSIANASFVPITFDTEDIDTDNGHSTSTNTSRYTGQTQGRFQISGAIGYAANATGRRATGLSLNGAPINGGQTASPATTINDAEYPTRTKTMFLNGSTDYVEIVAYQESGGALNTFATTGGQSSFSARMVGTT
jgi:hypothetical protein